jgi:hypothetical protein
VLGTGSRVFGNLGSKGIEILQNGYHLLSGRFLSFLRPPMYGRAGLLFGLAVIDGEIRKAFFSYLRNILTNPLRLFSRTYIQSLLILQPQDVLPSGEQDLCDGCPNKTYHEGRLVSMCRKEEYLRFGDMVTMRRKEPVAAP